MFCLQVDGSITGGGGAYKRQFKVCYKENKAIISSTVIFIKEKMAERFKAALSLIFVILKHPCYPAVSV